LFNQKADDDLPGLGETLSYVPLDNLSIHKQTENESAEKSNNNNNNGKVSTDKTAKNASNDFYTKWDMIRTNALKNTHNVF
jgi:hypothetical protein